MFSAPSGIALDLVAVPELDSAATEHRMVLRVNRVHEDDDIFFGLLIL
ncbi:hypothetical protein [Thiorhodococcus minor]|nr:hypothetical protein [Thiorhodococcus minor]